jgi:peptidyl-dipeptidase Dcp
VFLEDVGLKKTVVLGAMLAMSVTMAEAQTGSTTSFEPSNPFYAASPLPFQAPPFDRIHDADYEPAIEAGIAQQRAEIEAIADSTQAPTFANTIVALEQTGQLLGRVTLVFDALCQADTNPTLQAVQEREAPKRAALSDAMSLNPKLWARVDALYAKRATLGLDAESMRLLEYDYQQFVKAGAKLNEVDKTRLKKLNEEEATLMTSFTNKLKAAANAAALHTTDAAKLAGLTDAQKAAASSKAKDGGVAGYVVPIVNTTQQPDLAELTDRATRQALFEASWTRAERGGENDTRSTVARLAQLRAEKAKLLGFPNYAAWVLQDQMAKTPEAALAFMNALVPAVTAKVQGEQKDIQDAIDADAIHAKGGTFKVEAWDWEFYSEQVRKAKYDLNADDVKPYFELHRVLTDGVFYAAHELYGISFKRRMDIPVYNPDVMVYEVDDVDGKPMALAYFDYFKRDSKDGGAWMSNFVNESKLLGTLPVIYNVCNFAKPAAGEPALISFDDVTTMFHEFGHGLHGMFANTVYPSLSGANVPRDFVEFPSQFNEHWASYPQVFAHYAKHYQTGAAMPPELVAKIQRAAKFNEGYAVFEAQAAAQLDMQWHMLPANAPKQDVDAFEKAALERVHMEMRAVPPRYRSSYFLHIWANGYAAGYYAYSWSEMLDDAAYRWFETHGGLTRANGDRFRTMVLSRGNTEDLQAMYDTWLGGEPTVEPMLEDRGLAAETPAAR